jgi:hypothetical protein
MLYLPMVALLLVQNTGKITGKVTDALTHRPIQGVHVSGDSGSHFVGVRTGVDGSYTLDDVPAGPVRMTVNLDGYRLIIELKEKAAQLTLGVGETATRNFEMHPLGRIYGKLVDRDTGKPIEGRSVTALRREFFPGYSAFAGAAAGSSADGTFDIRNLEPGDYILSVTADGGAKGYGQRFYPDVPRRDMATLIHLGEGETRNIDISLQSQERHTLSGTVEVPHEFEGQQISFEIQAAESNGQRPPVEIRPGPFRVENLAPGSYRLAFTAGRYMEEIRVREDEAAADYEVEITDHDVDDFKAVLTPGAGLIGEVRMLEEDAKLPEKMGFALVPATGWFAQLKSGGTMVSGVRAGVWGGPVRGGRFGREFVRPGEYWPLVMDLPDGFAVAEIGFGGSKTPYGTVSLTAGDTPISIVLTSRAGSLAGVVRDEDQNPLRGAMVVLLPDPVPEKIGPASVWAEESGEGGAFVFRNLAPGKFRAVVLTGEDRAYQGDPGYLRERALKRDAIEVVAGQTASVSLGR